MIFAHNESKAESNVSLVHPNPVKNCEINAMSWDLKEPWFSSQICYELYM